MVPIHILIILLSTVTLGLALWYFITNKTPYRWNKAALAVVMGIVGVMYIIDGEVIEQYETLLVAMLVVMCLVWIATSWVKQYYEHREQAALSAIINKYNQYDSPD
jgi:uncharacterized membrane protein